MAADNVSGKTSTFEPKAPGKISAVRKGVYKGLSFPVLDRTLDITRALGTSFLSCRSGNFLVIGAVVMVPVIGLAGAALDYSRASDFRTRVQQAADAAVLAAAQTDGNFNAKSAIGTKVFQANTADLGNITLTPIFSPITNGVHVDISASIGNTFMKAMGKASSGFEVKSEAVMAAAGSNGTSGPAVEIALALDTTGSMKNDIGALRTSAASLVSTVMKNPNVYVSVVPFVAAVNVGATNIPMSAMDTGANSWWHASGLKTRGAALLHDCTNGGGGSSGGGPGGGGRIEGSLQHFQHRFASIATELFGISHAKADVTPNTTGPYIYYGTAISPSNPASTGGLPDGFIYNNYDPCMLGNPLKISHFDLFKRIPGARWKGCVQARTEPFDVTDDTPVSANPDTLFVPYFWPDENDPGSIVSNNYMPDYHTTQWPVGWEKDKNDFARARNILKYNGIGPANLKETAPDTYGPNKSCPDELLRLSNNKTTVMSKVNNLNYWSAGGTVASEGLAWGWRTLSPNAPFADAKSYSNDNHKIIVLMSDGVNELSMNQHWAQQGWWNMLASDYTSYGYLNEGRYPAMTFESASTYLDQRLAAACTNAKAKGIQIYTVIFREDDAKAVNNMKSCAMKPAMAYKAADQTALKNTFDAIANDINANNGGTDKIMPRLVK